MVWLLPSPVPELSLNPARTGLTVTTLDSGSSAPGSSAGWVYCVVFLGKTLNSHSDSLNGYRRQNAGGNLRWTSIPSRGNSNYLSRLHATEIVISSGRVGQLLARVLFCACLTLHLVYSYAKTIQEDMFGKFEIVPWLAEERQESSNCS